ncbi:hypothetical protein AB0E81_37650 [Streptomyces sp. NPDC033538]|uniref:hypothetical protein n=1 Tax=Streptomyces sp. NPDC033538 TaxID=3155367 RepID=UPI0033C8D4A6
MIAVLTSGVALGVHVPGLLLRRRLAEQGTPCAVYVLERWWRQADRDRLARSRDAFQRDFRLALATQRLRRRHDELVPPEARREIHEMWARAGVVHFVVLSGFWLPIVRAYMGRSGARETVDTCHLDSVDSPSFTPYAHERRAHRAIRLMDSSSGSLPWTIPVTPGPPVPWEQREDRVLVHGGGWSLGTYRDAAAQLVASGLRIDCVLGSADADPDGEAAKNMRAFRSDPAWHAWDDPGFPPLRPVGARARSTLEDDSWPEGAGGFHPSFTLTRHARAAVSKPGGGSLLDSLWAATPAVLLEPFGTHEERNAELWVRLGLGVRWDTWCGSGHSGDLLLALHHRALELRTRVPDYARALAREHAGTARP